MVRRGVRHSCAVDLDAGEKGVSDEGGGIKHASGAAAKFDGKVPLISERAADHRVGGGFDGCGGAITGDESEPVEMQDVALNESAVRLRQGYVELAACKVVGAVIGRDGRDPVMDDDFRVDRVPWCERGIGLGRSGNHFPGEREERTVAALDLVPSFARFHGGR